MNIDEITTAYRRAHRRLLFLDYDGTLVGYRLDPSKARPTKTLLKQLERLANDPANTVVIISGRDRPTLENWLGHVPLGFAAEHGSLYKFLDGAWQTTHAGSSDWKPPVRQIMDRYTSGTPGAWLEEKTSAFAWHTRRIADEMEAARLQKALIAELMPLAERLELRVLSGNRVTDVYPLAFSKGLAAKRWLDGHRYDFILAAGDDTTDEELFKAMPPRSATIKVGPGRTLARLRLPSHVAMVKLLETLAKTRQ